MTNRFSFPDPDELLLEDLARRAVRMDISLVRCDDGLAAWVKLEASATVPEADGSGRHVDFRFVRKVLEWFEGEGGGRSG